MMDKNKRKFCQHLRIIVARKLDVPPDNINMEVIIKCIEKAIRNTYHRNDGEVIVIPETKEEKDFFYGKYAKKIIDMIFNCEYPFYDWVERYEDNYVKQFLVQVERRGRRR